MASSSLSSSTSSSSSSPSCSSSLSSSSSPPTSSPSISPEAPATPTLSSLRASFITNIQPHSSDKGKSSTEKLPTNGNELKSSPADLLMIDDCTESDSLSNSRCPPPPIGGGVSVSKSIGGSIAVNSSKIYKPNGVAVATSNPGVGGTLSSRVHGTHHLMTNSNNNTTSSSGNNSNTMANGNCKTTSTNGLKINSSSNNNSVANSPSNGAGGVTRLRSINYVNNSHLSSVFASMNHMRLNGQLCDIILQASGSQLKAHKVVLSATSAYFNAMFNSEMSEKTKTVITLHDIDFNALKLLIDYSYSGEIVISEENVQALLPTASLLQVSAVREACCKFLLRQLDPSNCLGIRSFADAHSCEELHQTSDKFVVENFPAVAATEEFLLLPYSEVEDLISSNHLNVHDEHEVYNAVIRWVKYDLKSRENRLGPLLHHIRFPLIHKNTLLNHVCKEPLIEGNPDGKDLLIEAMRYHLSPDQRTNIKNIRTQYRRPKGLKTYIFAIGGGSLFAIHNECEFYDPVSDTWCSFAPSFKRRSRAGVTTLGRHLFAIGGYNENKELSSGEFYDPIVNSWQPLAQDMGTKRSCLALASLNGLIYAAGGYDGASCLASVERFDPLSDMWTSVEAMTSRRRHGRLTVLDGCLYSIGGYDGTNYQSTMERFDPREGKWQPMPPMTNRRSSSGVATLSGKIYAAGGNDGSLCMNSVEKFDPTRNAWELTAPMHTRRSTHEVVEADGFLYAIGGNDGSSSLNTVERFELKKNQWIPISSMMLRRSSVGAAALECPNMEKILEALTHHNNNLTVTTAATTNSATNSNALESGIVH